MDFVTMIFAAGAGEVVNGFGNITNMQQMTSAICSGASVGFTTRLMDTRDSKWYWVAKLKDGNCWMTQNLDLDFDDTMSLTSADSDVTTTWKLGEATQHHTITKFPSSTYLDFSYDPGEYVYITPMEQHSCGTNNITKLEGCPNWVNVSNLSPSTDPEYAEVIGNSNSTYNAHYLIGNYYTYNVAAAGTAPSAAGTATNSICPKGWTLPTGGSSSQYATLVSGLTASTTDTANNLKLAPYYFAYGGYVGSSSLGSAGRYGYYWSSTASSSTYAYYLYFDTGVNPSSNYTRYRGLSVRCVAR